MPHIIAAYEDLIVTKMEAKSGNAALERLVVVVCVLQSLQRGSPCMPDFIPDWW